RPAPQGQSTIVDGESTAGDGAAVPVRWSPPVGSGHRYQWGAATGTHQWGAAAGTHQWGAATGTHQWGVADRRYPPVGSDRLIVVPLTVESAGQVIHVLEAALRSAADGQIVSLDTVGTSLTR